MMLSNLLTGHSRKGGNPVPLFKMPSEFILAGQGMYVITWISVDAGMTQFSRRI